MSRKKVIIFTFPFQHDPIVLLCDLEKESRADWLCFLFHEISARKLWNDFKYDKNSSGHWHNRSAVLSEELYPFWSQTKGESSVDESIAAFMEALIVFYTQHRHNFLQILDYIELHPQASLKTQG